MRLGILSDAHDQIRRTMQAVQMLREAGAEGFHVRRVSRPRPDYLLRGHFHVASDTQDGSTRQINPGSLHEADQFTVALLDLESDAVKFIPIACAGE
jgi:predicted phosphodiesterase